MSTQAIPIIEPVWFPTLVFLSWIIGFLGSVTTAQILCQAHMAYNLRLKLWTILAAVIFGFTGIWSLHFIAMIAQRLPVPTRFNPFYTCLSGFIAVGFTLLAFSADMIHRYMPAWFRERAQSELGLLLPRGHRSDAYKDNLDETLTQHLLGSDHDTPDEGSAEPRIRDFDEESAVGIGSNGFTTPDGALRSPARSRAATVTHGSQQFAHALTASPQNTPLDLPDDVDQRSASYRPGPRSGSSGTSRPATNVANSLDHPRMLPPSPSPSHTQGKWSLPRENVQRRSSEASSGDRTLASSQESYEDTTTSSNSHSRTISDTLALPGVLKRRLRLRQNEKPFLRDAYRRLRVSLTSPYIMLRSFVWASGISGMHFLGMHALEIENGTITWTPWLVVASCFIAFAVCVIASSYIYAMEARLSRQLMFSFIATWGVFGMHYTGQAAATFHSHSTPNPASSTTPYILMISIATISIMTCLLTNVVLANVSATSRDKMYEIVMTKRRLWRVLAQKEAAEQANILKSNFISIASHEIRTPLHTVSGYSDLLQRTDLTEEQLLYLTNIRRAVHTIQLITRQVLDFSRMERKVEGDAHPVWIDLREAMQGIAGMPEDRPAEGAAVALLIFVSPDCPSKIHVDEVYLTRILMNLVSNALKFTIRGHVALKVNPDSDKSQLIFEVEDTGIGIPAKFQHSLFDPFTQADQTLTRKHTGTGLGLAIAKQLTDRLHGGLQVHSVERKGTTFTLKLPLASTPSEASTPGEEQRNKVFAFPEPLMTNSALSGKSSVQKNKVTMVVCGTVGRTRQLIADLWRQYGIQVREWVDTEEDGSTRPIEDADFVWIDSEWAATHSDKMHRILLQRGEEELHMSDPPRPIVCFPFNSPDEFSQSTLLSTASNVLRLQRPTVFHTVVKQLYNPIPYLNQPSHERLKIVRFASQASFSSGDTQTHPSLQQNDDASSATLPLRENPLLPDMPRVLLVEDNVINQRLGARILQKLSYEPSIASNGQEAVEMMRSSAREKRISCVLMDLSMPIMNGFEASEAIRQLEQSGELQGHVPIIALTANVSAEWELECKQKGMDGFLAKPLLVEDLDKTLARHVTYNDA